MSLSPLKSSSIKFARGVGVEVGTAHYTALALQRRNGFLHIANVVHCPIQQISDEIPEELAGLSGKDWNLCFSLPPNSVNDMQQIIPATLRDFNIEQHVQSQASIIGSMADEQFIYDYQVMPGMEPSQKTLIISLAKENVFEDSYELLRPLVYRSHQVTSCVFGMASAFFALHPEESSLSRPQLLISLKDEMSILCIIERGIVQYSGTMVFGARNLAVSLKNDGMTGRTLLEKELTGAIARWRENWQLPDGELSGDYWISGDEPVQLKRFSEMLGSIVSPESINLFGVSGNTLPEPDEQLHCELVIAFGLALQSLGESAMKISLLPVRMKWIEHKECEFRFLRLALILFAISLFALFSGIMLYLSRGISAFSMESEALAQCSNIYPEMEQLHSRLKAQQLRILPIAETVYRTHCYLEALKYWQQAQATVDGKERCWGIYMADEFSFERSNSKESEKETVPQNGTHNSLATNNLFAQESRAVPAAVQSGRVVRNSEIRPLHYIYVGGIVPLGKTRYKILKSIQTKLMNSGAYVNVDDHGDELNTEFLNIYYDPWLAFLRRNAKALDSEYSAFFLELPLSGNFIDESQLQKR